MVLPCEAKVIIIKYKYGATRIVNEYPEYEWNINGMQKLLKKIDETDRVARKDVYGQPKPVRTEENIKIVEEIGLREENWSGTHSTPYKLHVNLILNVHQCPV